MNKNIVISLFVFSSLLFSQQLKNEFHASYGAASVQEISSILNNVIILPFIGGDFTIESSIGPVIGGYKRNLSDHISLGIEGSYTSFDQLYDVAGAKFNVQNTFITAMISGSYCYNPKNSVQLYSGLSIGGSNFTQKDSIETASQTIAAFHINAIAARFGKTFAGFVELGLGYNGLVNGGVSIKF